MWEEEPKLRGGDGRGSPRAPSVVAWRPLWLRTLLVGGRGRTLGRRDGAAAVDAWATDAGGVVVALARSRLGGRLLLRCPAALGCCRRRWWLLRWWLPSSLLSSWRRRRRRRGGKRKRPGGKAEVLRSLPGWSSSRRMSSSLGCGRRPMTVQECDASKAEERHAGLRRKLTGQRQQLVMYATIVPER